MTWTPPAVSCVRAAWLALGSTTIPLENQAAGYFCSSLDLGYPDVRDVVNNRPDQDGIDDRTMYMGSRVVTAAITALAGAGARIDAVAASFAPFMVPSARPVLHYVLDRPGAAERTLTMRASGYSWPISGADQRDIQLQWVADPVARDVNQQQVIAWSGSSTVAGRTYPLTFNRIYPPGGGTGTGATIRSAGDVPVRPRLLIYGPITNPRVNFVVYPALTQTALVTQGGLIINAGHYLDVDTARKTAYVDGDPAQSVLQYVDWINSSWPVLPVNPGYTLMTLAGSSTSGITQVQATWRDGFLT
jgi:hypothetical protein